MADKRFRVTMWLSLDKTPPADSTANKWFDDRFPTFLRLYWARFYEEAADKDDLKGLLDKKIGTDCYLSLAMDFGDPAPDPYAFRNGAWVPLGGGAHEGKNELIQNHNTDPWAFLDNHGVEYRMLASCAFVEE